MKKKQSSNDQQSGVITDKKDKNAGSSAFNQGSEQDPNYNDGIADDPDDPDDPKFPGKKKETPKGGNIGKNNAGGYK